MKAPRPLSHVERSVPVLVAYSQREYREHERPPFDLLPCIAAATFAANSLILWDAEALASDDEEPEELEWTD